MSWLEKIKNITNEKKGKRGIENLVIILIVGVIIIIVASSFIPDDKDKNKEQKIQETVTFASSKPVDELKDLEERLEQILSEIEGAGRVKVMITGVSDGEVVHAYNQMEESKIQEEKNNADHYNRIDEVRREQDMAFMDGSAGRTPVVIKRMKPEIKGVVVVADGAGSSVVRQNISGAVEALMGIPTHRIQVLKRKS